MQCRISQFMYEIATRFQWLLPRFRSPATRWNYCEYSPTSRWLVNQRWPPLTGNTYAMSYISASVWDSNEIPTATVDLSDEQTVDFEIFQFSGPYPHPCWCLHGNAVIAHLSVGSRRILTELSQILSSHSHKHCHTHCHSHYQYNTIQLLTRPTSWVNQRRGMAMTR